MGWFYEQHAAHEGYVIGYVVRDGCAPEAGLYRELGYPRDDGDRQVACNRSRLRLWLAFSAMGAAPPGEMGTVLRVGVRGR